MAVAVAVAVMLRRAVPKVTKGVDSSSGGICVPKVLQSNSLNGEAPSFAFKERGNPLWADPVPGSLGQRARPCEILCASRLVLLACSRVQRHVQVDVCEAGEANVHAAKRLEGGRITAAVGSMCAAFHRLWENHLLQQLLCLCLPQQVCVNACQQVSLIPADKRVCKVPRTRSALAVF